MKTTLDSQKILFTKVFGKNTFHSSEGRQYIEYYTDKDTVNTSVSFAHWNSKKDVEGYNNSLVEQFITKFFPQLVNNFMKDLFTTSQLAQTPISFNVDSQDKISLRVINSPRLLDLLKKVEIFPFSDVEKILPTLSKASFLEFDFEVSDSQKLPQTMRSYNPSESNSLENISQKFSPESIISISDVTEYLSDGIKQYKLIKLSGINIPKNIIHDINGLSSKLKEVTFYQEEVGNNKNIRFYYI